MTKGAKNPRSRIGRVRPTAPAGSGRAAARDWRDVGISVGLVLAGCVVLLPNLGDRSLWQDEAECALVARGILRTGVPMAWDGRLLATAMEGAELADSLLWAWTPWAMHYVAAAGMAIFGQSSLGARLLFALLGCASIGLTYTVARRLIRDRWASCLAGVLLLTSVQYLLLMRQCRYYAIVSVAALVAVWGYTELSRRRGLVMLVVGMALLFHANYATCACVAFGLGGHAALWGRDRQTWRRLGVAAAIAAILTLPWFFGAGIYHVVSAGKDVSDRPPAGQAAIKLLFILNQLVCPFVVVLGLVIARAKGRLRIGGAYGLVGCMAVPAMILLPAFLWANPRYVVHMFPLGAIVVAAAVRELHHRSRAVGYVVAIVASVTHLLPAVPCALLPANVGQNRLDGEFVTGGDAILQAKLKTEWAGYVHELQEPFVGPNKAIVDFLNEHSAPNDIVYASYGQFPIMFHTNRRCAGLLKASDRLERGWDRLPDYLFDPDVADWLVFRPGWHPPGGYQAMGRRWHIRAQRTGRQLAFHGLSVAEIRWGNRPLLQYHYFRPPKPSGVRDVGLIGFQRPQGPDTPQKPAPPTDSVENGERRP